MSEDTPGGGLFFVLFFVPTFLENFLWGVGELLKFASAPPGHQIPSPAWRSDRGLQRGFGSEFRGLSNWAGEPTSRHAKHSCTVVVIGDSFF